MVECDMPEAIPRKFRFKDKSKSSSKRKRAGHDDEDPKRRRRSKDGSEYSEQSHREKRERRTRREKYSAEAWEDQKINLDGTYMDPDHRYRESLYDGIDSSGPALDPDTAFRESLFDALADDEGAAYWEGVYGQPIHTYGKTKTGPQGELEQMTDEEYAKYVRNKMWEKTHEAAMEEREAWHKAQKEKKRKEQRIREDGARLEAEREAFQQRIQESLKRGEERKRIKAMNAAWESYIARWNGLKNNDRLAEESADDVRALIPWPVLSGKLKDVSKGEIEDFIKSSLDWKDGRTAVLKVERVRWHPDKMQQRFGQHLDTEIMKAVTAVFQVIDRLWDENRSKT